MSFTTCTFPIPYLPPPHPPKFRVALFLNFSSDGCNTQEKWKKKVMENFGGQIRCIMGDVQVANTTNFSPQGKTSTPTTFKWFPPR